MTEGRPAGGGFSMEKITSSRSTLIVLVGALLALIGSFLPWATVSVEGFGSESASGMDGDGVITLIVALAAAAIAVFMKGRGRMIGIIVAAGIIILVSIIDIADVNRAAGEIGDIPGVDTSVGFGLWLVLVGGVVALVGAFVKD